MFSLPPLTQAIQLFYLFIYLLNELLSLLAVEDVHTEGMGWLKKHLQTQMSGLETLGLVSLETSTTVSAAAERACKVQRSLLLGS